MFLYERLFIVKLGEGDKYKLQPSQVQNFLKNGYLSFEACDCNNSWLSFINYIPKHMTQKN